MNDKPIQMGQLNDPRPDDPRYADIHAAIAAAQTDERVGVTTYGIWFAETGELVAIVHEGHAFWA